MDKWFNNNFERERLRKYTKKRLNGKSYFNFLRLFSVTTWLIIFNVFVYLLVFFSIQVLGEEIIRDIVAIQAESFFSGNIVTVISSMFVHFEVWHLMANMATLFFVGSFVEKLIGRKRFFILYIFAGIFAGLFYVTLSYFFGGSYLGAKIFGSPLTYAVGASGAIFSMLGVLSILTPYASVYLIAGPILAIILEAIFNAVIPNSPYLSILNLAVWIYLIFSIFSIFSLNPKILKIALPLRMQFWVLPIIAIVPLIIIGLFVEIPIGNSAHLGGLLVGMSYAIYLRNKYKNKTDLIRRYFSK
ncbi:MAG: rhomboid family intramembrane serine protease [Candidatus Pacearchaeota archaeon]|jgi:membrane associated rhomboid family serine protease